MARASQWTRGQNFVQNGDSAQVRIAGDDNYVEGGEGDDAMFSVGDDNRLKGDWGSDFIAMKGTSAQPNGMFGGSELPTNSGYDVCWDLSGTNAADVSCEKIM